MKKALLISLCLGSALMVTSCKNKTQSTEATDSVVMDTTVVSEPATTDANAIVSDTTKRYTYKGAEKELYVWFNTEGATPSVIYKMEGSDEIVELPQTSAAAKAATYSKDDITLEVNPSDELTLNIGGKAEKFMLVEPLTYNMTSTDGKSTLVVTYKTMDGKRVAVIQKDGGAETTLAQTSAFAKGAEYSDGTTTLSTKGDKATLMSGSEKIQYNTQK
ncbi:hypothetical protein [Porphyromonas pogonae]|uniref:hypothetical protein n=1 Tax=Porphyromonas pogonae TaxID=867595 RepID=UPI002E79727B|nr:hypothetical protein [Porphyromonas pogonae]